MRTTATIDDDIAVRLAEMCARDGDRFKTIQLKAEWKSGTLAGSGPFSANSRGVNFHGCFGIFQ